MIDAMKAFLGYDLDEVTAQHVERCRDAVAEAVAGFDQSDDELPAATRAYLRVLLVSNIVLSHQVAALTTRPSHDMMWPSAEIYEGLRKVGAEVFDA